MREGYTAFNLESRYDKSIRSDLSFAKVTRSSVNPWMLNRMTIPFGRLCTAFPKVLGGAGVARSAAAWYHVHRPFIFEGDWAGRLNCGR